MSQKKLRLAQLTKQAEDIRAKIAQAILEDSLEANKKVRFFFFCREFSDLGYIKRNWGIFFFVCDLKELNGLLDNLKEAINAGDDKEAAMLTKEAVDKINRLLQFFFGVLFL